MLTCKDVSQVLSQREDRRLKFGERITLRMHLAICNSCRNVNAQFRFLRVAVESLSRDENETKPE
jgi:hypothetical protein